MTCLNPRPLGKWASVNNYYLSTQENLLILRGRSKGKLPGDQPPPPPPEKTCRFLLQLVFCIKICLHHQSVMLFLKWCNPLWEKSWICPVLDYWKGLFSSPVISIPWTPLNTMANDDNFGKINSRQTPLQKHSNSDISCAGVSLSSL